MVNDRTGTTLNTGDDVVLGGDIVALDGGDVIVRVGTDTQRVNAADTFKMPLSLVADHAHLDNKGTRTHAQIDTDLDDHDGRIDTAQSAAETAQGGIDAHIAGQSRSHATIDTDLDTLFTYVGGHLADTGLHLAFDGTAKTASFTAVAGTLHTVDLSGASADFVVTFPSAVTGVRFGWLVKTAHASHTYGCEALSSASIRGGTSHDNTWSAWMRGELLIFRYDGSTWQVEVDGRIPHVGNIALNANQTGVGSGAVTKVNLARNDQDNVGMVNTGSSRLDIKRKGTYLVAGVVVWNGLVTAAATRALSQAQRSGTAVWNSECYGAVGSFPSNYGVAPVACSAGQNLELYGFQNTGANQAIFGAAGSTTFLSATELLGV